MAHLLTHDPTTCGAGKLRTHAPNVQDCSSADLLCVSTTTANAMKFANANADLECDAFVDANAIKTSGGTARLHCITTFTANPGKLAGASARLRTIAKILIGKTTITRIIRGRSSKPANACVKSGLNVPKTGGTVNVPKTGGTVNVPKTGGTVNAPKINSSKTINLRINKGRRC